MSSDDACKQYLAKWLIANCDVVPSRAIEYASKMVENGVSSQSRLLKKVKKSGKDYLLTLSVLEDDLDIILNTILNSDSENFVDRSMMAHDDILSDDYSCKEFENWMAKNKVDILPSRATKCSAQIVQSGINSPERLSNRLATNPTLLKNIGIDDDDAEEIQTAVEKHKLAKHFDTFTSNATVEILESPKLATKSKSCENLLGMEDNMVLPPRADLKSSKSCEVLPALDMNLELEKLVLKQLESTDLLPPQTKEPGGHRRAKTVGSDISSQIITDDLQGIAVNTNIRKDSIKKIPPIPGGVSKKEVTSPPSRGIQPQASRRNQVIDAVHTMNTFKDSSVKAVTKFGSVRESSDLRSQGTTIVNELNNALATKNVSIAITTLQKIIQHGTEDLQVLQRSLGKDACSAIVKSMQTFSGNTDCELNCLKAICLLTRYNTKRTSINEDNAQTLKELGFAYILTPLLQNALSNKNQLLVSWICKTAGKICAVDGNKKSLSKSGICPLIVEALTRFDVNTTSEACFALWNIADLEHGRNGFIQNGACEGILRILITYGKDPSVDELNANALRSVVALAGNVEGAERLGQNQAIEIIDDIASHCQRHKPLRSDVLEWSLLALASLISAEVNAATLLDIKFCETILKVLKANLTVENLCLAGCNAIDNLASNPVMSKKLGEIGACTVLPTILTNFAEKSVEVTVACCSAIGNLAVDQVHNREVLQDGPAFNSLILILQKYTAMTMTSGQESEYETVIWKAVWTLRKLCTGHLNRKKLVDGGLCEALNYALVRYMGITDIVVQILKAIKTLISDKNDEIVPRMGAAGVCKSVVKSALKNIDDIQESKLAADVLYNLGESESNIAILAAYNKAYDVLSQMLHKHSSQDKDLIILCCRLLHKLCHVEGAITKAKQAGGVDAAVWALQRQQNVPEVAEWATLVLNDLASDAAASARLGTSGGCEVMIAVLKKHAKNAGIAFRSFKVLYHLSLDANNRSWLGASGACETVIDALRLHENSQVVIAEGFLAIGSLADSHAGNISRLRVGGVCELIVKAMKSHSSNPEIIDNACYAIFRMAETEAINSFGLNGACETIVNAMAVHFEYETLAINCFQALQRLGSNPINHAKCIKAGMIPNSIRLLKTPKALANTSICLEGCKLLNYIAKSNDSKIAVGDAGACAVIADILRIHVQQDWLVIAAAGACDVLSTNCPENCAKFLSSEINSLLIACLSSHKDSDTVMAGVFQTMVSLVAFTPARDNLSTSEYFKVINKSFIKHHKVSQKGVLWGLKLIAAMSYDTRTSGWMGSHGACKSVPHSLLQFKDDDEIFMTGMLTLLALAKPSGTHNRQKLRTYEVCDLISTTIVKFVNNADGLEASCMALVAILDDDNVATSSTPPSDEPSQAERNDGNGRLSASKSIDNSSAISSTNGNKNANSTPQGENVKNKLTKGFQSLVKWGSSLVDDKESKANPVPAPAANQTNASTNNHNNSFKFESKQSVSDVFSSMGNSVMKATHMTGFELTRIQAVTRIGAPATGVGKSLVKSLRIHIDSETTATLVCSVLSILAEDTTGAQDLVERGICEALMQAVRNYVTKDSTFAQHACTLISILAHPPCSQFSILGSLGACEILAMVLHFYVGNISLVEKVSQCIQGLCGPVDVSGLAAVSVAKNKSAFRSADIFTAMYKCLDTYKESESTLIFVFIALKSLFEGNIDNIAAFCSVAKPDLLVRILKQNEKSSLIVVNMLQIVALISANVYQYRGPNNPPISFIPESNYSDLYGVMALHKDEEDIVIASCAVLESLIGPAKIRANAPAQLLHHFLNHFSSNTKVIVYCLRAIRALTSCDPLAPPPSNGRRPSSVSNAADDLLTYDNPRRNAGDFSSNQAVVDAPIKLLTKYGDDANIVYVALAVVCNLVKHVNDLKLKYGTIGNIRLAVKGIQQHIENENVGRIGARYLGQLAKNSPDISSIIVVNNGCNIIVDICKIHLQDGLTSSSTPAIATNVCYAINRICKSQVPAKLKFGFLGACEQVASILNLFSSIDSAICTIACQSIAMLSIDCLENAVKLGSVGVCELLVDQLRSHGLGDYDELARWACLSIYNMSADCALPESNSTVSSDLQKTTPTNRNSGSLSSIKMSFNNSGKDSNNGSPHQKRASNMTKLVSGGACEILVLVIQKYTQNVIVTEAACKAISSLAKDSAGKQKLVGAGAIEILRGVAQQNSMNKTIIDTNSLLQA